MPVAQFGGNRGWGYDGVLLYAPHVGYGGPDGLKRLVDAAHERGLMVFLDVVYNHFGPDGNYLHLYAPTSSIRSATRLGAAPSPTSRRCARSSSRMRSTGWRNISFDGLRLDAIDQIADQSESRCWKRSRWRSAGTAPGGACT